MRIKLKEGKQKEIMALIKEKHTWEELSRILSIQKEYLRNDIRREHRLLSEDTYQKICLLLGKSFDSYIIEKLDDNWGRVKGGLVAKNNTKKIVVPNKNEDLAEAVGIILGDGHISEFIRGKKIRNYFIKIAGNTYTDLDYLKRYIPLLFKKLFEEQGKIFISKKKNEGYFTLYGKNYVEFFKSLGLGTGNKKTNNQSIPKWIKEDDKLLKKCLRGLIDTDGSVHIISKNNRNIRISYTSYIPRLLDDVRVSLIKLGFTPSKIISERQIFISKQEEIKKYSNEIGFSNQKNLNRLKSFQKNAPVVQRPRIRPSQKQPKAV